MTDDRETTFQSYEDARMRVMAMALEACADHGCPIEAQLERCVDEALRERWGNPVKTYVPLLAFREVQECIRLGSCPEPATGTI